MRLFYVASLVLLMILGEKTDNIIQCLLCFILSELILIREKSQKDTGFIGLSNNLPELLNQIKKAKK